MADARSRGWGWPGKPGSAEDRKYQRDHITTITVGGIKLRVRNEVAPLFAGFIVDITSRGYDLSQVADDWGFNNRDIRGRPGVKSNHAWGLAVDLNATTNPMTSDGKVHTDMPRWVVDCATKWGLHWGGNYTGSRKDPMHFEFLGRPSDVDAYPLTREDEDMAQVPQEEWEQVKAAVLRMAPVVDRLDENANFRMDAVKASIENLFGRLQMDARNVRTGALTKIGEWLGKSYTPPGG